MSEILAYEPKTFGDWAYLAINKRFKDLVAKFEKDKDPEELHQMRVGMRRLRSAIAGFALAISLPKNARDNKVGEVGKKLGVLRDLDVLDDSLRSHYQPLLPKKEQKILEEALQNLAKQRKQALKDVQLMLTERIYANLSEAFQDWLAEPQYQPIAQMTIQPILPDLLLPQVSRLMLHSGWLVGTRISEGKVHVINENWDLESVDSILQTQAVILHALRKEAKRSRYNMELFTQFYDENYQNYLEDIKSVQSVLGELQDCFVLSEFLGKVFGEDLQNVLPSLAENFKQTRYQKWGEWQLLQKKFCQVQSRQKLHLTILQPIANQPPGKTTLDAEE